MVQGVIEKEETEGRKSHEYVPSLHTLKDRQSEKRTEKQFQMTVS
jgi:hypothetical protein